jgi:hypothetical protein
MVIQSQLLQKGKLEQERILQEGKGLCAFV